MARTTAGIDDNDVKSLLAVSSVDGESIVVVWADPVSHALLVKSVTSIVTSFQSPTGAVNGLNQTFIFATAPNAITVDGVTFQKIEQGGNVNWTGTTTIVMTVPPVNSIFGVA